MNRIGRVKKIIYKIFTLLLFSFFVSYCNKDIPSAVLKQGKLEVFSYLENYEIQGEIAYSKDFAFSTNSVDYVSINQLKQGITGKYLFYLEGIDSKREFLILNFLSNNVPAQVLVNGKLEFSNIPNTLDKFSLEPYILIPVSNRERTKVEIFVYPSLSNFGLINQVNLKLLSYSQASKQKFLYSLLQVCLLFGIVLVLIITKNTIVFLNSLVLTFYFVLFYFTHFFGFTSIAENFIEYNFFLKVILFTLQIPVLNYLYHRFNSLSKIFIFPLLALISLSLPYLLNELALAYENLFILSYYVIQSFLISLRKNLILRKNKKDLITILNSYKRELLRIRKDFVNSQAEFYQKILNKSLQMVSYMEKLEIQTNEMETFNRLVVELLEGKNINQVLDSIFEHLHTYYKADVTFIYFIDSQIQEFYAYRGSCRNIPEEVYNFMLTKRMPLSKEAGYSYIAYKRKKIIYKENIKTKYKKFKDSNNSNITYLPEVMSSLYIPIFIQDKFQGIFFLASFNHSMNLNKEKLKYISMFTNQVASAIQKEKILQEMEKEREKAEKAKFVAEEAMKEIEAINSLAKDINENLDLKFIMQKIMEFVEEHYEIHYYSLYFVNSKKTKVKLLDAKFPSEISSQIRKKISEIEFPLNVERGAHAFIYQSNKMIYFKTLGETYISPEEAEVLNYLNIASMIGIPLRLKGEVIGILSFYSYQKLKLTKRQLKTISGLGEQVAGAIHNSRLYREIQQEKEKSENLLLSILPPKIATELKNKGKVVPVFYESATILFTDFVGFTKIAEKLKPEQLLIELDGYFTYFDFICERFNLEKLKTIGDSYMCAGGLPNINNTHPLDVCLASLEFRDFTLRMQEVAKASKEEDTILWELRIGVHTGPLIGGVIGTTKFAFDVWGDSVNIASRTESSGERGKVNISEATYELVKEFFVCEYRGKISMKNRGNMGMYFLNSLKPEYSDNEEGTLPNQKFWEVYEKIKSGEISLFHLSKEKQSLLKVI